MSRPLGIAFHAALGLALAGALALGWAWQVDRARRWETPTLSDQALVPLRAGQRRDPGGRATWMVAVNPRCPRCLGTLRRLDAEWARHPHPERLAALIVDTPHRPAAASLRAMPPVALWWDRGRIWRRRWGHRLYGEVLRFDARGRYAGTLAGEDAERSARTIAPASERPRHD